MTALLFYICILMILFGGNILAQHCHMNCYGHGYCEYEESNCICHEGYLAPDCSRRLCPYDRSWVDKPHALDEAHTRAECSDRGLCDRTKGACNCFTGYTGEACQRDTCGGGSCGLHGTCLTIGEAYMFYTDPTESTNYTLWDSNHTTMCVCDIGFVGAACDLHMCPKGYDPVQDYSGYFTLTLRTHLISGEFTGGFFKFTFDGQSFLFPSNVSVWDGIACETSFNNLPNVRSAQCSHNETESSNGGATYTVQLKKFPNIPYQNNIFSFTGLPSESSFSCVDYNVTGSFDPVDCEVKIVTKSSTGVPEYEYCSSRGICDFTTGACDCYPGFTNVNCDTYYSEITVDKTIEDVFSVNALNSNYTSHVVHIDATYTTDNDMDYIRVSDYYMTRFLLSGYGDINMYTGGFTIEGGNETDNTGGVSIHTGGLTVKSSISIYSGGLYTNALTVESSGLYIGADGIAVTGGVSIMNVGMTANKGLTIASKGLRIASGGVGYLVGGATVESVGLAITGGMSIAAGGLWTQKKGGITVGETGVAIAGGLTIANSISAVKSLNIDEGITVYSGGIAITGGASILAGGLFLASGGLSIYHTGLFVSHGVSVLSGGLTITSGITIVTSGIVVSNGITVADVGMFVPLGAEVTAGVSVTNGGLFTTVGMSVVHGGVFIASAGIISSSGGFVIAGTGTDTMSVLNCGMWVTGGVSVNTLGLQITEGLTINSDGIIAPYGITVVSGGMDITNGVTVNNLGIVMTGGLTLADTGVTLTVGLTVHNDGLTLTGGLSIPSTGIVIVSNGLTVYNSGVVITGGVSVVTSGLVVQSGGLSIITGGLILTGGMTVKEGGIVNVPLTVNSNGISAKGGFSVLDTGIFLTAGMTVADAGLIIEEGGLQVQSNGLIVSSGVTVNDVGVYLPVGLTIMNHGLVVSGGMSLLDTGLVIPAKGLTVHTGGVVVKTGGVAVLYSHPPYVHDGMVVKDLGMYISNGMTIYLSGIAVTGGVTVSDAGLHAEHGSTILSGGLFIVDGASIKDDGLIVTGGLTSFDAFTVTGGITVKSKGLYVQNGATVFSHGMYIKAGGMSSTNAGINVMGGGSVDQGGVLLTGGVTIYDTGAHLAASGLTIASSGLKVTGGLSAVNDGVVSAKGMTVIQSDVFITGGVTIMSGGLVVTGGLTVQVRNHQGMQLTGGLSINNGGLYVTDGTSVNNNGMFISGGLTVLGNSAVTTYTTSDRRLKTDIVALSDSLNRLSQLRGVSYSWLKESQESLNLDDKRHVGVIAQDVQRVLPEAVTELHGGKYLGVNYEELLPLLLEAVRELDARTAGLHAQTTTAAIAGAAAGDTDVLLPVVSRLFSGSPTMSKETQFNKSTSGISPYNHAPVGTDTGTPPAAVSHTYHGQENTSSHSSTNDNSHLTASRISNISYYNPHDPPCDRGELLHAIEELSSLVESAEKENALLEAILNDEELVQSIDWDSLSI